MPRPPLPWSEVSRRLTPEKIAAFLAQVAVGDPDECWEWQGSRSNLGYGAVAVRGTGYGPTGAHRVAYGIANGGIPDGMYVCHSCDNPPCCNPNHLFVGTHRDNMRDMDEKGRSRWYRYVPPTHCPKGHEYTPENNRAEGFTKSGHRRVMCRTCHMQVERINTIDRQLHRMAELQREVAHITPATLDELIEALGSRRAFIFAANYGLFGQPRKTLTEIGKYLGVSRERARQLRATAIDTLQARVGLNEVRAA